MGSEDSIENTTEGVPSVPSRRPNMKSQSDDSLESRDSEPMVLPARPLRRPSSDIQNELEEKTEKELNDLKAMIGKHISTDEIILQAEIPQRPVRNEQSEESNTDEPMIPKKRPARADPVRLTELSDSSGEMVEPLIPKRPIRRTTENIPTLIAPLKPKKASTSNHVILQDKSEITEVFKRNETEDSITGDEDLQMFEDEDEKPAEQVDIIQSSSHKEHISFKKEESSEPLVIKDEVEQESVEETIDTEVKDEPQVPQRPKRRTTDESLKSIPEPAVKIDADKEELNEQKLDVLSVEPSMKETHYKTLSDEILPEDTVQKEESPVEELKEDEIKSREPIPHESAMPSRSKRQGPPPVPKKPSSKIAAFQEMLQKQQIQNLAINESSSESDKGETVANRRNNIANNLNGLFALPGMVPGGAPLPVGLSKKLGINTSKEEISTYDHTEVENEQKVGLSDVRQKRARGPRGRKLPSNVSNIKKVVDESKNIEIEIFDTWTVVSKPDSEIADEIASDIQVEQPREEEDTQLTEPEYSAGSEKEVSDTIIDKTQNKDSRLSVEEAIETRDQNEQTEVLEQQVEDMVERLMQEEFIKEDINDEPEIDAINSDLPKDDE